MEIDWTLLNKTASDIANIILNLPGLEGYILGAGLIVIALLVIGFVVRRIRVHK
jgi:hypothetical protein